ncbi:MAG: protein-glutamate O-methyltransferase CheR [Fimbriimonadales bacterium]
MSAEPLPKPGLDMGSGEITPAEFARLAKFLYEKSGINLQSGKENLVKSRLSKKLREHSLANYDEYLDMVERDKTGAMLSSMMDALSTNKTSFFREPEHFTFFEQVLLANNPNSLKVWSAGCSSGEEPYTLSMILNEKLGKTRASGAKILATDLSTRVLAKASSGEYLEHEMEGIPPAMRTKYFSRVSGERSYFYRANQDLKQIISFARLNLMGDWPMKGPFDAIFCRNVMIYFDKPTKEKLVQRYFSLLRSGGYLFIGHSESLSGLGTEFKYVQPALYEKP